MLSLALSNNDASQVWEPYKEIIRNSYLVLDHSLEEVTQELNRIYGFAVSKAQVEYRCKQWSFRKSLSKQEWEVVGQKIQKRKRDNKESEVWVDGLPMSQRKVKKAMSRYGFSSSSVSVTQPASPQIPQGITIRTPTLESAIISLDTIGSYGTPPIVSIPSPTDYSSTLFQSLLQSLPYTKFRAAVITGGRHDDIQINENRLSITIPDTISAEIIDSLNNELIRMDQVTSLDRQIEVLMPRSLYAQNSESRMATSRHNHQPAIEFLSFTLFLISNKIIDSDSRAGEMIYEWISRRQDRRLLGHLLSIGGPTSEAIAEHIFPSAIAENDVSTVEALLTFGLDPNDLIDSKDIFDCTPLQLACEMQHLEVVKILLQAGAEVNGEFHNLEPPLLIAIDDTPRGISGKGPIDIKLVKILLHAGACVNPSCDESPLWNAATCCQPALVDLLLDHGANPNFVHEGRDNSTPLFEVLKSYGPVPDILSIARSLVRAGAEVNVRCKVDDDVQTVLSNAVFLKDSELVKLLLDYGACVGELELVEALRETNDEILSLLLDNGPRITSNVIVAAVERKDIKIFQSLLNKVDQRDKKRCRVKALTAAIRCGFNEVIKGLSKLGTALPSGDGLQEAIQAAAGRGDNSVLRLLLDKKSKYRASAIKALDGALFSAIANNHDDTVELLLEAGADVRIVGKKDPLLEAIRQGRLSLSRRLLAAGATVNTTIDRDNSQRHPWMTSSSLPLMTSSALLAAVAWGHFSLVQEIIEAGAEIDAPGEVEFRRDTPNNEQAKKYPDGIAYFAGYFQDVKTTTALSIAVEKGDWTMTQLLIGAGADVNAPAAEFHGHSALKAAIRNNNHLMVCYLLDLGANPNESALIAAVPQSIELIRILLSVRMTRSYGRSRTYGVQTMQRAIMSSDFPIVELLLTHDVNPNVIVRPYPSETLEHHRQAAPGNWSALGTAIRLDNSEDLKLVRLLLENRADPNKIVSEAEDGENARTGLLVSIRRRSLKIVELLVNSGADVNRRAELRVERTPLQSAAEEGVLDIAKCLLEKGAQVNAPPHNKRGATALQFAAMHGRLGMALLLLEHGADVNAQAAEIDGRTALEGACEHGRIDMVQLLLSAGALVNGSGSEQYERSLGFAKENGHRAVGRLLEKFHAEQLEGFVDWDTILNSAHV